MNSKLVAVTLCAAAYSLVSVQPAQAAIDILHNSPTSTFLQSGLINTPNDPGFNFAIDSDTQRWTYFRAETNGSFDRISWYGSYADGPFAVDFFSASCYSCGLDIVNGDGTFTHSPNGINGATLLPNPGPFNQNDVHRTFLSGNLYAYYIDLGSSISLNISTIYALSVVNNYSTAPFGWATSTTQGTSQFIYGGGSRVVRGGSPGLAFTLTNTTVVPLPSATWLFLTGLMGLLASKFNILARHNDFLRLLKLARQPVANI